MQIRDRVKHVFFEESLVFSERYAVSAQTPEPLFFARHHGIGGAGLLGANQSVALVDANVGLVAEHRDGKIDGLPVRRSTPFLDRRLLCIGAAPLWDRNNRSVELSGLPWRGSLGPSARHRIGRRAYRWAFAFTSRSRNSQTVVASGIAPSSPTFKKRWNDSRSIIWN